MAEEAIPIILVQGFLGQGTRDYWGDFCSKRPNIYVAKLGCVSSLHDRVCELFAQIKGGICDYGEEHAQKYRHQRFGKEFPGFYPKWDEDHPIHLLGHSLGGCTITLLQTYLDKDYFQGYQTSGAWLKSVATLMAPHHGATAAYILGAKEPEIQRNEMDLVHPLSVGSFITKFIHLYEWLDIGFLKNNLLNFELDHWKLTRRDKSLSELFNSMFIKSELSDDRDNAAYDLTVHAQVALNKTYTTHPKVYYRSYAASMTEKSRWNGAQVPEWWMNPLLQPLSIAIGSYKPEVLENLVGQVEEDEWLKNDGVAPLASQFHPRECSESYCQHRKGFQPWQPEELRPGQWDVFLLENCSHCCIVPFVKYASISRDFQSHYLKFVEMVDKK